jgi:hypothetical protein
MDGQGAYGIAKDSVTVNRWLAHMDEWTQAHEPWGISALVLHRPQLPYGESLLVISLSDIGLLKKRITDPNVIGEGDSFIRFANGATLHFHSPEGGTAVKLRGQDFSLLHQWIERNKPQ